MLQLLWKLLKTGSCTAANIPSQLDEHCIALPQVTDVPCATGCKNCAESCPTGAVSFNSEGAVNIDLGSCISCNACIEQCPTGTLVNDRSTEVAAYDRQDLLIDAKSAELKSATMNVPTVSAGDIFKRSLAIRVISTGCSACDLEIGAASNPIFDMERFGVHIVASPRFADALLITGPVPEAMHAPLLSAYEAMSAPKLVIACGSCAISGGVHKDGYARANGVTPLLPVDVFIPGCAPHPWQIIRGLQAAKLLRGRK